MAAVSLSQRLGHGQASSANKISSAAKCLNESGMVPIPQTGRGPSASTSNALPICDRNACQELEGKNRLWPFARIPVVPLNSLYWSVITKTACRSTFTDKPKEISYGFFDNYDSFVCAHG